MKEIRTAFRIGPILSIHEMYEFQDDLKVTDEVELEKLISEIINTGMAFAPDVYLDPEDGLWKIIDAHHRKKALIILEERGWKVPKYQTIEVLAKDREEAKLRVLQRNSQYGRMTVHGLISFAKQNTLKFDRLATMRFEAVPLKKMTIVGEHLRSPADGTGDGRDALYTKKIQAPIYTPKGEKPALEQLVDRSKTDQLLDEISAAKIPEEIKSFLYYAAARHMVFNYERIAEYYAHAPAPVQDLMEKSALVIIDFQKAIELGFVALSEALAEAYKE